MRTVTTSQPLGVPPLEMQVTWLAGMAAAGGLVALVAVATSAWAIGNRTVYLSVAGASAGFGVMLYLGRKWVKPAVPNIALLTAIGLITVSVWVVGADTASVLAMGVFYSWTLALAFAFNPFRVAVGYLGLVAALLGAVLFGHHSIVMLVVWLDLVLALGVPALIIGYLLNAVRRLAREDPLTQLPNRRAFEDLLPGRLALAARDHVPIALAMLDLDNLKAVNDTGGHAAGDELLVAAAQAWTTQLRAGDVLCRVGGDEFALLLPDCDARLAATVIHRMRRAAPHIPVSAGISAWHGQPPAALIRDADHALYRSKQRRRGRSAAAEKTEADELDHDERQHPRARG